MQHQGKSRLGLKLAAVKKIPQRAPDFHVLVKLLVTFVEGGDDDGDIARLEAELRMRRDEIARDPQLAAMYLD